MTENCWRRTGERRGQEATPSFRPPFHGVDENSADDRRQTGNSLTSSMRNCASHSQMAGLIDFAIGTGGNAGTRFRATGSRIYGEEYHWSIRLLCRCVQKLVRSHCRAEVKLKWLCEEARALTLRQFIFVGAGHTLSRRQRRAAEQAL